MWQVRVALRPGARGPAVAELRWRLAKLGYGEPGGGSGFDEALAAAVRAFQAAAGLVPDGIVGPATWGRLYALTGAPSHSLRWDPAGALAAPGPGCRGRSLPAPSPWAPRAAEPPAVRIEVSVTQRRLVLHTPSGAVAFPAAVGRPEAPTPTGRFAVAELVPHPGPPLGTRWIRLEPALCSTHGTDEPWLGGGAVPPGCVCLYNKDAEFVYHRIAPGTPVDIRA